ncbi:MAG: FHA domain-containing protein [Phycisphaerales bacterium]|nr:MAG: FHA domain-containing protein [Phycisphaerales bacterium]
MTPATVEPRAFLVSLPSSAPQVRITAGAGTAGEKTWNLRRHVTVIGSQRKAHIVLHGSGISKAHCVIVNTGKEVYLKDLHSDGGTLCNDTLVSCRVLRNGDVVKVGATEINVEMTGVATGSAPVGPVRIDHPGGIGWITAVDEASNKRWRVRDLIAVVGRAPGAEILVQEAGIEPAHAILFKMGDDAVWYDLPTSSSGRTDGEKGTMSLLTHGATRLVGSLRLGIEFPGLPSGAAPRLKPQDSDACAETAPAQDDKEAEKQDHTPGESAPEAGGKDQQSPIAKSLADLEEDITALHARIDETWDRFNQPNGDISDLGMDFMASEHDLAALAAKLNEREAAIRGYLHDLTHCHEQLVRWEQELAARAERIHDERMKLYQDQTSWAKRKAEIARKSSELDRRERTLREGKPA